MKKLFFLLVIVSAFLTGCATKVSQLDSKAGEAATAYYGKVDDMMADLRLLLATGPATPVKIEEGPAKGYFIPATGFFTPFTYKIMLVPVKGLTDDGKEVDARAVEIDVTRSDGGGTGMMANITYNNIKKAFDTKYPVVRVKQPGPAVKYSFPG